MERNNDREPQREDMRAIEEDLKDSFSTNIGTSADKFLEILRGSHHSKPLPGEPDRIARKDNLHPAGITTKLASKQTTNTYEPPQTNKYAEITKEIEGFSFAEDEVKRKKQISVIAKSIRSAVNELIIQEVANNTKKYLNAYAKEFYKKPGGLKVVFDFGDGPVSLEATGAFKGNETLLVHKKANKIVGAVVKIGEGDDYDDLSDNFSLQVK